VEAYERAAAAAPNLAAVLLNLAVALTERGTQLKNAGGQGFGPTIFRFIVCACFLAPSLYIATTWGGKGGLSKVTDLSVPGCRFK
jgi:hypothetical protein